MSNPSTVAQSELIDKQLLHDMGIDSQRFLRLYTRIEKDIAAKLYPGAAVAIARKGRLLAKQAFGHSRIASDRGAAVAADDSTLWLMYSQTKPIVACASWILAERGLLNFHEPVMTYLADFAKHGKSGVTVYHLLTHQAGFPNAKIPEEAWENPELLKQLVCDFQLEWEPGSKVLYHGISAHWVLVAIMHEITGVDFREFIKNEITDPLGLKNMFIGANEKIAGRLTENYERDTDGTHTLPDFFNSPHFIRSGMPGAGGFSSAADLCLFYQMLLGDGELNGVRLLSPRMVRYVTRNHTGDRNDDFFCIPMHRALGVHVRGQTPTIRGLGSMASPSTFGHGGVGTSYSFADPESGVSFTFLSNSRISEPYHSTRLEELMSIVHSSIVRI